MRIATLDKIGTLPGPAARTLWTTGRVGTTSYGVARVTSPTAQESAGPPGQEEAAVELGEDGVDAGPDFDSEAVPDEVGLDEVDAASDPGLDLPFEPGSGLPFGSDPAPLPARLSLR
ncbi:MAG: hypothetical protein ACRDTH_03955 [Pseudonocardiaceae bacterium]